MSESLNAHLDLLEKANDQGEDYETWLEKRVTKLEEEKAVLLDYNKKLVIRPLCFPERSKRMELSEEINEYADSLYSEEWKDKYTEWADKAEQLEAKLTAIECAGCGKTMLECECDEVE